MIIGVPRETFPGEKRVALVPNSLPQLTKLGLKVIVERDAGLAAGFTNKAYEDKGATIYDDRPAVFRDADLIAQVRTFGANPDAGGGDIDQIKQDQLIVGHAEPLTNHDQTHAIKDRGAVLIAMELVPRITRAQAMDALSSQANLAGYRAVLLAAHYQTKIFPLMMTAAGTVKPAKVFVIGAGVAGLQAIATAKRLGAVVSATDVRPATKEQVESLGGKFVMVEEAMAEGEGGYAKELTPEQQQKQKELVAGVVAESDVVITTAAIPGRKAPVLVTGQMVQAMHPGSVIVDMAAERGGNCELTQPGEVTEAHGVTIVGLTNLPSSLAHDASATYSTNIVKLVGELLDKQGNLNLDLENEVIAGVVVTKDREVIHPKVRELMGMEPMTTAPKDAAVGQTPDGDNPNAAEPGAEQTAEGSDD